MKKTNNRFFCLPALSKDFIFTLDFYNIPRERLTQAEWEKDVEDIEPVHIKIFDLDRNEFYRHEVLPGNHLNILLDNESNKVYQDDCLQFNICRIVSLETKNSFPQDAILTVQKRGLQVNQGTILIDSFVGEEPSAVEGSLLILAHKLICREDLFCDIFSCCPANVLQLDNIQVVYHWNILNCLGEIIAEGNINSKLGHYIHVNINSLIERTYFDQLLTLKMTSNYKNQATFTVLHNDKTIAIEHSLPPNYYLGDKTILDESRKYAFGFTQNLKSLLRNI